MYKKHIVMRSLNTADLLGPTPTTYFTKKARPQLLFRVSLASVHVAKPDFGSSGGYSTGERGEG